MMAMIWNLAIASKRRLALIVVPIILVGFAVCMPRDYTERMATIMSPEESGSAADRKDVFKKSLKETVEHPLFGIGPGMFQLVSGKWIGTHNTYTQLSSEAGIPALLLFLWILKRAFSNLWYAKKSKNDEIRLFANAVQAALLGLVVGGWFVHAGYQAYVYFLIAHTSVLCRLARNEQTNLSSNPAPVARLRGMPLWPSLVPAVGSSDLKTGGTGWRP